MNRYESCEYTNQEEIPERPLGEDTFMTNCLKDFNMNVGQLEQCVKRLEDINQRLSGPMVEEKQQDESPKHFGGGLLGDLSEKISETQALADRIRYLINKLESLV